MPSSQEHRTPGPTSSDDADRVLAQARRLQVAAQAGLEQHPLRGKNFGLLCETDDDATRLFRDAAVELGAHVAHIQPSFSELSTPADVQRTARLLGRLYDAVECQGMPPALVQQIASGAGVPVYQFLAGPQHPTARLAERLGGDWAPQDKRRFVLQAVLLGALA